MAGKSHLPGPSWKTGPVSLLTAQGVVSPLSHKQGRRNSSARLPRGGVSERAFRDGF